MITARKWSLGQGNIFTPDYTQGEGGWFPSMQHRSHDQGVCIQGVGKNLPRFAYGGDWVDSHWDGYCRMWSTNKQAVYILLECILVTARKCSLQRLCFYMCLSVILFTGGSASVHAGIPHPPGTRHPPWSRHPSPRADTPRDPPPGSRHPQEQSMLGDTVNERVVRILLECNLVLSNKKQTYICYPE